MIQPIFDSYKNKNFRLKTQVIIFQIIFILKYYLFANLATLLSPCERSE